MRRRPFARNCQSSSVSLCTASANRVRSSSSDRNAPCEQQPSFGRPATVPWQAGVPNTHAQRDSNQVRSAAIRCSGLSGS
ncbi:Uncharacterised protein [Mycobacterium tuberculosis]|uniref:Uncharacterized protein n=1 Tax=Mycobacterium tuberculosis TaxID=1773 RepID=A0A916LCG5_MYCTX|nr:Uncharacterised protein [Mycobacterium tuberculosis]COZ66377.1 Uncharacterised protein [Mycobacterium tuberculosis]COZ75970.1 Uncharacterised protein [Mycobacterium tuberculosis]